MAPFSSVSILLQATVLALAMVRIYGNYIRPSLETPTKECLEKPILRLDANVRPGNGVTLRCTVSNYTLPPDWFLVSFFGDKRRPIGGFFSLKFPPETETSSSSQGGAWGTAFSPDNDEQILSSSDNLFSYEVTFFRKRTRDSVVSCKLYDKVAKHGVESNRIFLNVNP